MLRRMHRPLFLLALMAVSACVIPPPPQPAPISAESMTLAQAKWDTLCSTCHGRTGRGDGVAAAMLNPAPRDYSDRAWQKSVTDESLAVVIVRGGAGVGQSVMMPPSPDLTEREEVVRALVQIVPQYGAAE